MTDKTPQENNDADSQPESTDAGEQQETKDRSGAKGQPKGRHGGRYMLVRYGKMGMVGCFKHEERHIPAETKYVIIHTERGMELGEMIAPFVYNKGVCTLPTDQIESYWHESGPEYPVSHQGRFVRFATDQDVNEQRHLEKEAVEERNSCEELIAKYRLPMQLVTVEHLFGGDRIIYYFMSEGRIDFRELVKELAHRYQTRIEMRQVGARDEARLIADFETCGRQCCCKNFLKILAPVNMRMAKVQKATLDPSKISGRCGRLKCCLRYEDNVYCELSKRLPKNNTMVVTDHGEGLVIETQIITQLVKVRMKDNRVIAVPLDEIREFRGRAPAPKAVEQEPARREKDAVVKDESPAAATTPEGEAPRKKKRRRRKKKKKGGAEGGNAPTGDNLNQDPVENEEEEEPDTADDEEKG